MQLNVAVILTVLFSLSTAEDETNKTQECIDYNDLKNSENCCRVHRLFPESEFGEECTVEYGYLLDTGDMDGWTRCYSMCIAEKSGAVSGEKIHLQQWHKYANYFNGAISRAYRVAIDQCDVMNKMRKRARSFTGKCNPLAMNFNSCVTSALMATCPRELTAEVCQKFKAGVPFCK